MRSIIVKAPAKVNLYLDVINKRPDGYHNIETIFERITLCDWIKVSLAKNNIKVVCSLKDIPVDNSNTAYKAARVLIQKYNLKCGFKIEIDKRIPHAAGLGGGSSDAASVILAINYLLGLKAPKQTLMELAGKIGADVGFFISELSRAIGSGIGNKLKQVKVREKMTFLVVSPGIKIPTFSVYASLLRFARNDENIARLALTKNELSANISSPNSLIYNKFNINNILYNKLEDVVLPSYPVLGEIKKKLSAAGAEGVLVSGSGSGVYGIFRTRKEALRAKNKLMNKGKWQLFLANNY